LRELIECTHRLVEQIDPSIPDDAFFFSLYFRALVAVADTIPLPFQLVVDVIGAHVRNEGIVLVDPLLARHAYVIS
jgi:hypothetical protein